MKKSKYKLNVKTGGDESFVTAEVKDHHGLGCPKNRHAAPKMLTPLKCETELEHEDYRVRNSSGLTVAHCSYKEHAAHIVDCVNSHEELLEALKMFVKFVEKECATHNTPSGMLIAVEHLIAKAEGK